MKIITEAGCNWSTMDEAKQFIDESKRLGLWATKFQLYDDDLIKDNPDRKFLKSIMIDEERARELFEHGHSIGQEVFFSCMTLESVEWVNELGVNYIKIRHVDQDNKELLKKIIYTGKEIIMSTDVVKRAPQIHCLFCVPNYPANIKDYKWIMRKLEDSDYQGISDHCDDLEMLKYILYWDKRDLYYHDIYFEKHVCLTKDCLEANWSITFDQLEEVLK